MDDAERLTKKLECDAVLVVECRMRQLRHRSHSCVQARQAPCRHLLLSVGELAYRAAAKDGLTMVDCCEKVDVIGLGEGVAMHPLCCVRTGWRVCVLCWTKMIFE